MRKDLGRSKRFMIFAVLSVVSFFLLGANSLSKNSKEIRRDSIEERKVRLMAETIALQSPEFVRGKWCEMARKSPLDFLRMTCDDLGPLK
jgi:hypothetical protein